MTSNIDVMSSITIAQQGKRQTAKNSLNGGYGLPPSGNNIIQKVTNTLDQRASISNR